MEVAALERGHARQAEVCEVPQPLEEVVDRFDRDVDAVREVDPLERRRPLDECVDCVVGQVGDLVIEGDAKVSLGRTLDRPSAPKLTLTRPIRRSFDSCESSRTLMSLNNGQPEKCESRQVSNLTRE